MNIWDYLILTAVGICVMTAAVHLYRNRSAGCSGCCSACRKNCANKKEKS